MCHSSIEVLSPYLFPLNTCKPCDCFCEESVTSGLEEVTQLSYNSSVSLSLCTFRAFGCHLRSLAPLSLPCWGNYIETKRDVPGHETERVCIRGQPSFDFWCQVEQRWAVSAEPNSNHRSVVKVNVIIFVSFDFGLVHFVPIENNQELP